MVLAVRAFSFSPLCSVVCCLSHSPDQQLWRAFIYLCQWTLTHTHTLLTGAHTSNVQIHGTFCVGWLICHNLQIGPPIQGKLPCSVCCCAFCLLVHLLCLLLVLPECFIHSVDNNWVASPSLQPLNVSVSLCFSPLERFWRLSLGQSAALWPFEKVAMWVPASHWSSFPVQCLLNPRDRYKLLNRKHAKKKKSKVKEKRFI